MLLNFRIWWLTNNDDKEEQREDELYENIMQFFILVPAATNSSCFLEGLAVAQIMEQA